MTREEYKLASDDLWEKKYDKSNSKLRKQLAEQRLKKN